MKKSQGSLFCITVPLSSDLIIFNGELAIMKKKRNLAYTSLVTETCIRTNKTFYLQLGCVMSYSYMAKLIN